MKHRNSTSHNTRQKRSLLQAYTWRLYLAVFQAAKIGGLI